jgi:hypothetical protein
MILITVASWQVFTHISSVFCVLVYSNVDQW